MATYGAYMKADQNLPRAARTVAVADTGVGIVAGLAIFPIVFAMGFEAGAGPTLMFQTLPMAFHGMPAGALFGLAFFCWRFLLRSPRRLLYWRRRPSGLMNKQNPIAVL